MLRACSRRLNPSLFFDAQSSAGSGRVNSQIAKLLGQPLGLQPVLLGKLLGANRSLFRAFGFFFRQHGPLVFRLRQFIGG